MTVRCSSEDPLGASDTDVVFMVFNRDDETTSVTVPPVSDGFAWLRCIDTANPDDDDQWVSEPYISVEGNAVVALSLTEQAGRQ